MHAIGGKYSPIEIIGMTSARSEYEGLLLGLDYLVAAFSPPIPGYTPLLPDTNQLYSHNTTLIVRGDCKMVIDQMNSKSAPRKLEQHYNLAMSKIQNICQLYTDCCDQRLIDSACRKLNVRYEHIRRELNYFCDTICKMIMNYVQVMYVRGIQAVIDAGRSEAENITKGFPIEMTLRIPFFKDAIREIRYNPHNCHSSRLFMACSLAENRMSDALILDKLSTFFGIMARH